MSKLVELMREAESKLTREKVDIDTWESEGGAIPVSRRVDAGPKIPDYPRERTYTCPGCNKGVRATRIGNSCSYLVEHIQGNECKYKGPVKA
jgi:hypothetical protein